MSKETNYTPGPWSVFVDDYVWDKYTLSPTCKDKEEEIANARLISYAPELLEILTMLIYDEHGNKYIKSTLSDDEWDKKTEIAKDRAILIIKDLRKTHSMELN